MSFTMMMFTAAASTMTGELPPATAPVAASVEVMVLGTYHFGNPGRDMVNVKVDDVTSPRRQRELDALAQALLAFRPTRVMVEIQRPGPSYDVPEFAGFSLATLTTSRNEIAQIGYRVAALAHLPSVQGIDEQPGKGRAELLPDRTGTGLCQGARAAGGRRRGLRGRTGAGGTVRGGAGDRQHSRHADPL